MFLAFNYHVFFAVMVFNENRNELDAVLLVFKEIAFFNVCGKCFMRHR